MTDLHRLCGTTTLGLLRKSLPISLLLVLFFGPAAAPAQDTGPVKIDTAATAVVLDTLPTLEDLQNKPRKAILWAAIPGGGQVYNKRWWKVPLVYGGLLGMIAYADFNQTSYRRFTTALENRCVSQGDECVIIEDQFPNSSNDAVLLARANADKARQTAYIGIFVVYLLQAVEAYTDAHLQEFDISDDLSIRLGPVVQPDGMMAAGLTVPLGSGRKLRGEKLEVQRLRGLVR